MQRKGILIFVGCSGIFNGGPGGGNDISGGHGDAIGEVRKLPRPFTGNSPSAVYSLQRDNHSRKAGRQAHPDPDYLDWRDNFYNQGLGRQHCQECQMPRTMRKIVEDTANPERVVARHLWTGGRSNQRLASALGLAVVQPDAGKPALEFHVMNMGAGHSVPTGSNRKGVYLTMEVVDSKGKKVAEKEWLFAPWYGARPDDGKYLDEDKKRPDAVAAAQTDAQVPRESIISAGDALTVR